MRLLTLCSPLVSFWQITRHECQMLTRGITWRIMKVINAFSRCLLGSRRGEMEAQRQTEAKAELALGVGWEHDKRYRPSRFPPRPDHARLGKTREGGKRAECVNSWLQVRESRVPRTKGVQRFSARNGQPSPPTGHVSGSLLQAGMLVLHASIVRCRVEGPVVSSDNPLPL